MQLVSGTEATCEIRFVRKYQLRFQKSYIIALVGLAANNDRRDALADGVDVFMVKPAKFIEFERMWTEILSKQ